MTEAHGCNDNGGVMDWPRVRDTLKSFRESARLTQVGLASAIGVNKSTINRIENVYGEPDHTPDLSTIERWVTATGSTLTAFFAHIEGLAPIEASPQTPPAEAAHDDSLPAFESEERIAQNVLRLLTKLAGEGVGRSESERVEDHRLPTIPRALAAERRPLDRTNRRRDVQRTTNRRRPVKKRPKDH